MQKSRSASSLIVEGEPGQEGNERSSVPESAPLAIVDSEDPAVDADEQNTERLSIAWKALVNLA
jgi:hypothetical protein